MRRVAIAVCAAAIAVSGCTSLGLYGPEAQAELRAKQAEAQARRDAQRERKEAQARAKALSEQKALRAVPVCSKEDDCSAKWEAAQLWVVNNAGYKLQTVTDVVIETYNSSGPAVAVRVLKQPIGQGKYELIASVYCDNPFGCTRNVKEAVIDFNRKISRVKAPE